MSLDPGEQSIEADSQINRSKTRLKKSHSTVKTHTSCEDTKAIRIISGKQKFDSSPKPKGVIFVTKGEWTVEVGEREGGSSKRRRYNAPPSQLSRFGGEVETTN